MKVKSFSPVRFFTTPWTAAYQAPLSMGFSRQEYWSGVPLPSPGVALLVKNLPANVGEFRDTGSIPGSERSSGEGICLKREEVRRSYKDIHYGTEGNGNV